MPYFPLAGFCFGLSGYVLYGSSLDRMAAAAAARPAGGIGPLLALFAPPLVLQGINGSCVWGPCTKLVANRVPPERLTWQSGIVAPADAGAWTYARSPGWHRRFCNRHGPC